MEDHTSRALDAVQAEGKRLVDELNYSMRTVENSHDDIELLAAANGLHNPVQQLTLRLICASVNLLTDVKRDVPSSPRTITLEDGTSVTMSQESYDNLVNATKEQ